MTLAAVSNEYQPQDLTLIPLDLFSQKPAGNDRIFVTRHALFICHGVHHMSMHTFFIGLNFVSTLTEFLLTVSNMSYLYSADDFDANGNFISTGRFLDLLARGEDTPPSGEGGSHIRLINNINWNDPSLYTMPLTDDEIAALTHDIAATNHPLPELPPPTHVAGASTSPARTPSPKPSEIHDQGPVSPTQSEVSDTSREVPELLQREANTSTWAARNPTRATIRPRTPPPRLTDAQKASRKIKRDQTTEKRKRLHNAVAEYLEEQRVKIEALSRAHSVTPKAINDIIGGQTHYRNSRKMQVKNALVHAKSKEMNAGT